MHCMEQYLHLGPDAAVLRGRCMSCVCARSSCEGYAIFFLLSVGSLGASTALLHPVSLLSQQSRTLSSHSVCTEARPYAQRGLQRSPVLVRGSEKKCRQLRTATLLCAPRVCGVCVRHVHCPGPKRAAKNRIGSLQLKELKCRREC